jgi:diguanylate cyclase (GGDEF)-like protein
MLEHENAEVGHMTDVLMAAAITVLALGTVHAALRARRYRLLAGESEQAAHRDELTGLGNRRAFDRALGELGTEGALIVIDLDNFKQVNDRLGHPTGDRLLRDVAREIRARVRETDLVARLGGDEFAVVLRGADAAHARAVGAELAGAVREAAVGLALPVPVMASVGAAPLGEVRDTDDLVTRADAAMYRMKNARRSAHGRRRFRPSGRHGSAAAERHR